MEVRFRFFIKLFGRAVLCAAVALVIAPSFVSALTSSDIQSLIEQHPYYDPSSSSCGSASTTLTGNDSIEQAYLFFIGKGLTPAQSSGIVANMKWESGLDPENIENPAGRSQNPADAGSGGWGIVQWTPGSTKAPAIAKAAGTTTPIYELGTQLEMVWAQLTRLGGLEQQAGDDIKNTSTPEDAVRAFQGDSAIGGKFVGFERPKDEQATLKDRIGLADQILKKFGGSATPTGGSCTGIGQNTQYVDGFTVYSQYDPAWANKSYGTSNISDSGCGPTAMAMIVTTLTGQQITPDVTAAYADSKNLYVSGAGSSWSLGPVLAAHWGLKSSLVDADSAKITSVLQSGALVLVVGRGADPFTQAGHFIVIRAATASGNWLIGDSNKPDNNHREWSPQLIMDGIQTNGSSGSIYAITK